MKTIGQICCFNFLLFKSEEPDISFHETFLWSIHDIPNSLCLIIGDIDPKNVYVQNQCFEKYIQERHKPYLCYFFKAKRCFIAIEAELTEFLDETKVK